MTTSQQPKQTQPVAPQKIPMTKERLRQLNEEVFAALSDQPKCIRHAL